MSVNLLRTFFCFVFLSPLFSERNYGQVSNPCGVVSKMSLSQDTIFTVPNVIEIESLSENATSYTFLIDNVPHWQTNQPLRVGFGAGLTEVKLVAYNGTCSDTSVRYIFVSGVFPSDTSHATLLYGYPRNNNLVKDLIAVKEGGYLLAGRKVGLAWSSEKTTPYLVKIKPTGCIDWAKTSEAYPLVDVIKVEEATDGSFFVAAGETDYYSLSFHLSSIIMRISSSGDLLWVQHIGNGSDAIENNLKINGMKATPDGGVVVTGTRDEKSFIVRLSGNGNIVWQKTYDYHGNFYGLDQILYKDQFLYIGGLLPNMNSQYIHGAIAKLDFSTGDIVWLKLYKSGSNYITIRDMHDMSSHIVVNLTTPTSTPGLPMIAGYMKIDTDGNVQNASLIADIAVLNSYTYYTNATELIPSGNSFYILSQNTTPLPLQPYISYGTVLVKLDNNMEIDWAYGEGGAGRGIYQHLAPAMSSSVRIAGLEKGGAISPNDVTNKVAVKRFDAAGNQPTPSCTFGKKEIQKLPLTISVSDENWTSYKTATLSKKIYSIPWESATPKVRYTCPDYVDSCSFLRLTGPATICNLTNTYSYRVHKNKGCGQPTRWTIPPGVNIVSQTDSMLLVKFPSFGRYKILIEAPFACSPLADSVIVEVSTKTPLLNLGGDTSMCPGNSVLLRAGPQFYSYRWSDGNTDSTLEVNVPGNFSVETVDECGNIFRDTIVVTVSAKIPLSIGNDRVKCNNDTVQLRATAGFLNYTWSPDYNITSLTGQNVVVNPATNTSYYLRAEKKPGCFAYDTISIIVHVSPAIMLGKDTSICSKDTLILNAGNGFSSYAWNNGQTTQQLHVSQAGSYTVIATTAQGCSSSDTVVVEKVFPLPFPELQKDIVLCEGIPYNLSAKAGYVFYTWNDGSSGSQISIVDVGTYSVSVVDNNGCSGTDTTIITKKVSPPSKFLPADTVMCYYDMMELQPLKLFESYLWSNGSSNPVVNITQPGEYWLEVTDNNRCKGIDSIAINRKECIDGFFIPTAFTPNNDQLNDVFKPLLYGPIQQYQFKIFDRWGKVVFQSEIIGEGWDGSVNGKQQNSGVYIWTCTFQLPNNNQPEYHKGAVRLIR